MNNSYKTKYLKPAEVFITDQPYYVQTILGSCVSITMFHGKTGVAAICHGMLPTATNYSDQKLQYKFLDYSFYELLKFYSKKNISLSELNVCVYGGADMFSVKRENKSIGRLNIEMAFQLIEKHELKLLDFNVGGYRGRKIIFNTFNGEIEIVKEKEVRDLELIKQELIRILKGNNGD